MLRLFSTLYVNSLNLHGMTTTLNLSFNPFPLLKTERLTLRKIEFSDVDAVFKLRSDKRNMEFLDRPLAKEKSDANALIAKIEDGLLMNAGITWGITFNDADNELIGTIGYWRIDIENHRAEIGYILHRDFHRKGLMHEAMQEVIDYGFKQMNLHSVEAVVNPANAGSIGLLLKNNFVKEALFKEDYFFEGRFLDSAVYSLLTTKNAGI